MPTEAPLDPLVCPLCGKGNACANLADSGVTLSCWCSDPAIKFPETLLAKVATELKGKACICRTCALKHQAGV